MKSKLLSIDDEGKLIYDKVEDSLETISIQSNDYLIDRLIEIIRINNLRLKKLESIIDNEILGPRIFIRGDKAT